MSRHRRTLRFPSCRNLLLYHEWAFNRRSQAAVAAEAGLSQRRVSQIGQQVQAWVSSLVKPLEFPGDSGKRFHLAIALERIRLHDAYDPLLGMFTGDDGEPRYLRRYVTVVNGEPLNTIEVSEKPDLRLEAQAADVEGRLAELEAVANRGPFADLPTQLHQTITHRFESKGKHTPCAVENKPASLSNASPHPSTASIFPSNMSIPASNATENCGSGLLNTFAIPVAASHLTPGANGT